MQPGGRRGPPHSDIDSDLKTSEPWRATPRKGRSRVSGHYTGDLRGVVTEFKDLVIVLVYFRTVAGSTAMQDTRRATWGGTE